VSSTPPFVAATASAVTIRHELSFLNGFRLVQALVYVGLAFGPAGMGWPELATPGFARAVAMAYLLFALLAVLLNRRSMPFARTAVASALVVDIAAAVLAIRPCTMHASASR
jgi:two-component system sensor histidine kinase PilS (NtrC family)